MVLTIFIVLQVILALLMAFHDWISITSLNEVRTVNRYSIKWRLLASIMNASIIVIPISLSEMIIPRWLVVPIVPFWMLCNIGAGRWWTSYLEGRGTNPTALNISKCILSWLVLGFVLYLSLKRVC